MMRAPKTLIGQIIAYAIGGGAITLLHSGAYWLLAEPLRVDAYLANTIAAIVAALINWPTSTKKIALPTPKRGAMKVTAMT